MAVVGREQMPLSSVVVKWYQSVVLVYMLAICSERVHDLCERLYALVDRNKGLLAGGRLKHRNAGLKGSGALILVSACSSVEKGQSSLHQCRRRQAGT